MANGILFADQTSSHTNNQYRLPESDRQKILAQAGLSAAERTERMRQAFIAAFGCPFGQNIQKN